MPLFYWVTADHFFVFCEPMLCWHSISDMQLKAISGWCWWTNRFTYQIHIQNRNNLCARVLLGFCLPCCQKSKVFACSHLLLQTFAKYEYWSCNILSVFLWLLICASGFSQIGICKYKVKNTSKLVMDRSFSLPDILICK